jgi:hypothetical protein
MPPADDSVLDIELRNLEGGYQPLAEWRGRRLLLVFVQPLCRYSRTILPALASMPADPLAGHPTVIVIGSDDLAQNRRLATMYGIRCPFLIQDNIEVAELLGVEGTPAGCFVTAEGEPITPATRGAAEILGLLGVTPAATTSHWWWGQRATRYADASYRLWRLLKARESAIRRADGRPSRSPGERAGVPTTAFPLVSAVMATRDRPRFARIALECYRRQTYRERELLVIDDGSEYPIDRQAVADAGGRLIRVPEGTPPGAKINLGASEARGSLCQIWDDDDWYAPGFVDEMVSMVLGHIRARGEPVLAYLTNRFWLDLSRWELYDSAGGQLGATLIFRREDWEKHPFREIRLAYDTWFLVDQIAAGVHALALDRPELYIYVRHTGLPGERSHTWRRTMGRDVDDDLRSTAPARAEPAAMLPDWALRAYRDLWR